MQALMACLKGSCFVFEEYYDLYYLTGLKLSKGTLFVGEKPILLVDPRYEEIACKQCPWQVRSLSDGAIKRAIQEEAASDVGFDGQKTSYDRFLFWQSMSKSKKLENRTNPLQALRMVKALEEIGALEKSAALLMQGFAYLESLLKEGVTEEFLSKELEIFFLKQGAQRLAFEPIIAFGANSAMPHYRSGDSVLKFPSVVLIDIGIVYEDYASDRTRTLFVGEVDPRLVEMKCLVLQVHEEVLKHVKAGVSIKFLDRLARDLIKEGSDYPVLHSLGHGIGLEVHEYPRISVQAAKDELLQKGMVITIEPGLYLPGVGGVRHEDTVVVLDNGYKNFSLDP